VIVRKGDAAVTREEVLAHIAGRIAKWWMPDDVAFVDQIPHTATGKISKLELREQFKDYRFPTA
jgi:3-(methylthio)propionyl---CoA ligase